STGNRGFLFGSAAAHRAPRREGILSPAGKFSGREVLDAADEAIASSPGAVPDGEMAGAPLWGDPADRPRDVGVHGDRGGRGPADAGARGAVPPGGAEALLLEEREVGAGPRGAARRPAGILGAERVPHARRSLEGRAVLRSLVGAGQAHGSITTFIESGAIDFRTAASASLSAYRCDTNERRGYCPMYRAIWRRLGP